MSWLETKHMGNLKSKHLNYRCRFHLFSCKNQLKSEFCRMTIPTITMCSELVTMEQQLDCNTAVIPLYGLWKEAQFKRCGPQVWTFVERF